MTENWLAVLLGRVHSQEPQLLGVIILGFSFGWKLGVVVAHILCSSVGWQSQSLPGFKLPPIDHGAATVMAPGKKRTTTHWLTNADFTATVRPTAIFAGRDNFSGVLPDHRGRERIALIKSSLWN